MLDPLFHLANYTFQNESFVSTPWTNQTEILNCIDQSHNNLMYLRLYVDLETPSVPQDLNVTIKYMHLNVEYNNSYTAQAQLVDSVNDNVITTYGMTQTATGLNTRQWSVVIPTSLIFRQKLSFSNLGLRTAIPHTGLIRGNSKGNIILIIYQNMSGFLSIMHRSQCCKAKHLSTPHRLLISMLQDGILYFV